MLILCNESGQAHVLGLREKKFFVRNDEKTEYGLMFRYSAVNQARLERVCEMVEEIHKPESQDDAMEHALLRAFGLPAEGIDHLTLLKSSLRMLSALVKFRRERGNASLTGGAIYFYWLHTRDGKNRLVHGGRLLAVDAKGQVVVEQKRGHVAESNDDLIQLIERRTR
jgi:hypothetical protein